MTDEPTPEEILQREERGFADALLFVAAEAESRWPAREDVVEIHRRIFQEANSAMAGQYRKDAYWPHYTRFVVPNWQDVPACMLRLGTLMDVAREECDQSRDDERDEKVIEWVARLHHRLECIHPFQDGNGRTGRAIATWILLHYDLPPFDVRPETRTEYIDALAAADEGLRTDDLFHADHYPHQTVAPQRLIGLVEDILYAEIMAEEQAEEQGTDTGQ